jgi:hypothetical protein
VNESAELETKPEGGTTKYSKYTKIWVGCNWK